ncbi:uncharacterized protein YndB with AHSA1/START domain [Novosphingobium hassiacum]|uniref:Uncharacterized protein YndB with AHSA1/START domain n=1 Tax=Novosphingobium hassiacum TaxID=173676 RepID=A0A7W5ZS99_9SPHN|nr:SRPBCC family protein [Novosphingobium hassiacum]MBB3859073.1 uncharacterized protein YndB with AHSA1/START domain [Novosphingobium hassiacum]
MIRIVLITLTAGLCSLAVPASAEVAQKSDAGFVVRVTDEVAVTPAEAWKAFTTPSSWWNGAHTFSGSAANMTLDPTANGCFCERLPVPKDAPAGQKPGSVMHMRVLYAEPYRALRLTGGLGPLQSEAINGTMTVTFKPIDGPGGKGTRILWEYVVGGFMRYKTDVISGAVDKVLTEQLGGLIKLLGPLASKPSVPSLAPELPPTDEEPAFSADPAKDETAAGESVKAALDKMFKKKSVSSSE